MGAGIELAVRKRPGSPFAELNVRLRVKLTARTESVDSGFAARRILTTLKNYRTCPGTGKHQRREHPGGTEADDDGTGSCFDVWNVIDRLGIGADVLPGKTGKKLILPGAESDSGGAGIVNVIFLSRIERTLDDAALRNVRCADAELFCSLGRKAR